ncbi:hypothetical protein, variant [Verruconis gallopava]|uniref:NAD(P)-binding domain-containing protein n=1 Tax=Verruconis gallopava TaxID=253628 RepID=A0A0D1Y0W7_9PEZI|nr:hypothetical protein, variant [Verruconis gallopava]KIW08726.1 hypothetical protein, variant [Verruconis gallopava]
MSAAKPTLAFFGATGGCACTALALALKDGYQVSALARTPQKLRDMLEKEHAVPRGTIDANLTIIQGNVTDISAVKKVLAPEGIPVSLVIFAVGGVPKFNWSLFTPFTLDQPTICEDGSVVILAALRELRREGVIGEDQKPTMIAISSTGLTKRRDVPIAFLWLYHVTLKIPHLDKKVMERLIAQAATESGHEAPIDSFVILRPSLLMDGPGLGMDSVRSGWVEHELAPHAARGQATGPAIGYTIRRSDVGRWLYENAIRNVQEWRGRCVSLTY